MLAQVLCMQEVDEPSHLGQRFPARLPDRLEALVRSLSGRVRGHSPRTGLDDDHREVVRDDVVQLASDPGAFAADSELGERLLLMLQVARSLRERADERAPQTDLPPHPERDERFEADLNIREIGEPHPHLQRQNQASYRQGAGAQRRIGSTRI